MSEPANSAEAARTPMIVAPGLGTARRVTTHRVTTNKVTAKVTPTIHEVSRQMQVSELIQAKNAGPDYGHEQISADTTKQHVWLM